MVLPPGGKSSKRFLAAILNSWYLALRNGQGQLPIEESIIKASGSGVIVTGSEVDLLQTGPINCCKTHRAGFTACVDLATLQFMGVQCLTGHADGHDFSMGSRITRLCDQIHPLSQDLAVTRYDGTKRAAAPEPDVFNSEFDGMQEQRVPHQS